MIGCPFDNFELILDYENIDTKIYVCPLCGEFYYVRDDGIMFTENDLIWAYNLMCGGVI